MELLNTPIGCYFIDSRDKFVAKELRLTGDYQPLERALYFKLLKPTDDVLWLGAHIGALMVPLSRVVNSIVAFEANPNTYEILRRNIEKNQANNVTAYNLAANDSNGKLEFLCNVTNSGGSKRMPKKMEPMYLDEETQIVEIEAVSIDDYLSAKPFDFIFMDIEGSEYPAIKGMSKTIAKCRTLVVEFIPHHLKNVAQITVDQFLEPLQSFADLYVPELRKSFSGDEIRWALNDMQKRDIGSSGLIFLNNIVR